MTAVVTGANGHVGANLVRALLAQGRPVRAVVHRNADNLQGLDVELVRADVRERSSLHRAFEDAEVVYHLASLISISGDQNGLVRAINVEGARNVAEAALDCRVGRLVHFSSIHAFRQTPVHRPLDESRPRVSGWGHPAYDRSKAAGEQQVRAAVDRGLDAVILNPTAVIGPSDHAPSRMGRVLLSVVHKRMPALTTGGFDWVDVRDVVRGALAAETHGRPGECYLLGGTWRPVSELAQMMANIAAVRPPRLVVPMWMARLGAPFADAYGRVSGKEPLYTSESLAALRSNRQVEKTKASQELGYRPRPTRETLEDLHTWFGERGMLDSRRQRPRK